jgi:1-acyl-sn-glycerol-3-phosphate acyltransferase
VIGAENIPSGGNTEPHVVMSKHSSTWETFALNVFFPALAFVAKKELLAIPFFGWAFKLASPITIDRKAGTDAMQQIIEQGRERLRQGFWCVVYPEGTRIRAGTRARYKTGGARLALALNIPILPVAHNAGYLWPKGVLGKRAGTLTISFGPPIEPRGKTIQGLTLEVESWIENEVARIGAPTRFVSPTAQPAPEARPRSTPACAAMPSALPSARVRCDGRATGRYSPRNESRRFWPRPRSRDSARDG